MAMRPSLTGVFFVTLGLGCTSFGGPAAWAVVNAVALLGQLFLQ